MTPISRLQSGLEETRHVFLRGNGLPERARAGFHIAELGFGTGLNLLATLAALGDRGPIRYTSFEAFPMSGPDMARALAAFPDAGREPLLAAWGSGRDASPLAGAEVRLSSAMRAKPCRAGRAGRCVVSGRLLPRQEPRTVVPRR
jgi:hypothetical protein